MSVASPARASFPAGVWARVDAVSFEPDAKDPQRVRVDGTFMVAHTLPDSPDYPGYSEPQVGYMYYACDGKQLAVCVMEWQELAAIAGSEDRCRGWGDNSLPDNGSVRAGAQEPMDPDAYPIAGGVLQGFTPCEVLKAWEMSHGTSGTTSESGGETGTGGDASTGGTGGGTSAGSTGGDGTGGETAAASSEGGGESKGDTGALVTTGDGGDAGPGPTGSSGGGDGTGANGDVGTVGEAGEPAVDDGDKGCACRGGGEGSGAGALMVAVGLGLVRRRRGR